MRATLAAVVLTCAGGVPAARPAAASDVVIAAGACAACHPAESAAAAETGGHAAILVCSSCHRERKPRRFGRGHRTVPRCASHHETVGHPPKRRRGRRVQRNCLKCHNPHGTDNLAHVRADVRHRRRLIPIEFTNASGSAPGGFTNPDDPGSGLCEACHRSTRFYRRDGSGEAHFSDPCTACHAHQQGFQPVAAEQNCTICHVDQGARFEKPSEHAARFLCTGCHPELSAEIGDGHRAVPACADCHDNATHAPTGPPGFECAHCHNPHGTDNLSLVVEDIVVPQGGTRPIVFTSIAGRQDGSFASASAPGTGLCEVCHTGTAYYRADGMGASHFTVSCVACHEHAKGFLPQ